MDAVIDRSADLREVVIGMPHRGRLNVLANIVGKPYSKIFGEFEGNLNPAQAHGSGDVSTTWAPRAVTRCSATTRSSSPHRQPQPPRSRRPGPRRSGPVQQDQPRGPEQFAILPLMLHGDAAFAGQGVVAETPTCRCCPVIAPAAPCTSWSTIRSASPPHPNIPGPPNTATDIAG